MEILISLNLSPVIEGLLQIGLHRLGGDRCHHRCTALRLIERKIVKYKSTIVSSNITISDYIRFKPTNSRDQGRFYAV